MFWCKKNNCLICYAGVRHRTEGSVVHTMQVEEGLCSLFLIRLRQLSFDSTRQILRQCPSLMRESCPCWAFFDAAILRSLVCLLRGNPAPLGHYSTRQSCASLGHVLRGNPAHIGPLFYAAILRTLGHCSTQQSCAPLGYVLRGNPALAGHHSTR
jgi:hypothetical protein